MKRAFFPGLALALLLSGCAGSPVKRLLLPLDAPVLPLLTEPSEPEPAPRLLKQYVVLLPDDDGSIGAIDVTDRETTVTLDQPYQAVSFDRLQEPYTIEHSEVGDDFGVGDTFAPAVAHLPPPPTNYTLYFGYASQELTADSLGAMSTVLAEIASRAAPTVSLEGHADRAGTEDGNEQMSRRRAEAIRDQILATGVAADSVALQWFGEDQLAVDTEDGVPEGRNRRVEIRIR